MRTAKPVRPHAAGQHAHPGTTLASSRTDARLYPGCINAGPPNPALRSLNRMRSTLHACKYAHDPFELHRPGPFYKNHISLASLPFQLRNQFPQIVKLPDTGSA